MEPTTPPAAQHELVLRRVIDAPREIVFKAWTEHLPEWWGPHGMTTPVCEMELRAGGRLRTVMRDGEGNQYPTAGVFLEVLAPQRIVFTDAYAEGWIPSDKPFMTAVITMEERDGRTIVTSRALHWTAEDLKIHEEMGFHDGWGQSADRFEAVVRRLMTARG